VQQCARAVGDVADDVVVAGGLDAIDAIDAIDAVDVGWLRAGYRAAAAMSVVQLRRRERRYAVRAVLAAD